MKWFKTIVVDLAVTALILVAVTLKPDWARGAVLVYTPFMLLLKVIAWVGQGAVKQLKPRAREAPAWMFHVLYAVNVAALAWAQWWWTAVQWAVIWLVSYLEHRRLHRPA